MEFLRITLTLLRFYDAVSRTLGFPMTYYDFLCIDMHYYELSLIILILLRLYDAFRRTTM